MGDKKDEKSEFKLPIGSKKEKLLWKWLNK